MQKSPCLTRWTFIGTDLNGNVTYESVMENLSTNGGKDEIIKYLSNIAVTAASGFVFLGVGASSTAAVVTDAKLSGTLGHEYIDNPTRKVCTNSAGTVLTSANIQTTSTLVGSFTFTRTIRYKAQFLSTDGIVGPLRTYGLFSTWVLPATVDGTSGIMNNEIVDTSNFNKDATNNLDVFIDLYW